MKRMERSPTQANRVLSLVRKMFNLAELWGYRPDGSNPCRHVPKYPEKGSTRLITDEQMVSLFAYLDKAEAEGLEHPIYLLAVRLQFEFAARMSEIRKWTTAPLRSSSFLTSRLPMNPVAPVTKYCMDNSSEITSFLPKACAPRFSKNPRRC
nr:integrase [Acidovorax sp. KKS102]